MTASAQEAVLGRVTSVFGVQGWLKIYSYTQPADNILSYPEWVLCSHAGQRTAVSVVEGRWHGKTLIAKLRGVSDRNQAAAFADHEIRVATTELPELPEGEYYWYQLEKLAVFTLEGERFGVVDHLIETGANDVLVVKPDEQSLDDRQRLIPFVPETYIRVVDLEGGALTVDWDPEF